MVMAYKYLYILSKAPVIFLLLDNNPYLSVNCDFSDSLCGYQSSQSSSMFQFDRGPLQKIIPGEDPNGKPGIPFYTGVQI